ncbi:MAG TPA: acyltransferase [Polyangia bacterium]|nr:acyltransferase [Polyangia bacterium]
MSNGGRYIKALDGIRGFGILFVVLFHYLLLIDRPSIGFAWVWVQMFFVQSGFLITGILLADKERRLPDYLKRFYSRRALRIFPLYFGFILVCTAAYLLFRKPAGFNRFAPYLYTYTYNFSRLDQTMPKKGLFLQFWSLAVEEQFYLFWPFVIYFLGERALRRVLIAIIVAAPLFRFCFGVYLTSRGFGPERVGMITYAFTFSQLDAFALGAAIPVFRLRERVKRTGGLAAGLIGLALAVGLVHWWVLGRQGIVVPLSNFWGLGMGAGVHDHADRVWSYTVIDLAFMGVTLHLASPDYRGLFNSRPLIALGKIVYGLYVFHYVIVVAAARVYDGYLHNATACFLLAFVACWAAAYVSYYGFEKRFLALRSRARRAPGEAAPGDLTGAGTGYPAA